MSFALLAYALFVFPMADLTFLDWAQEVFFLALSVEEWGWTVASLPIVLIKLVRATTLDAVVEITLKNYVHTLYYVLQARIELPTEFPASCIAATCPVPISSHLNVMVTARKLFNGVITWGQLFLPLNDASRRNIDGASYTTIDGRSAS